eukprot:CAMPEP_0180573944 /NCGR_PEP_ID=MMETSP1037_2-20121125/10047_1 /TAXON_ID=632150 /ORGANISM="Azadinium spinosum, Strain 3D9" /LENGTH=45 /DNA_ID= /DNA_START= /DNA_END= /DNA_ORIENTATION=
MDPVDAVASSSTSNEVAACSINNSTFSAKATSISARSAATEFVSV